MIWWFLISVNFLFFLIKSFFTPKATIYRNDLNTNFTNSSTEKYILGENYNLTSLKLKIDFGSLDTGTKIIEYSKGIINIRSIQQYDYDSYMLTPCNSDIWWIYSFSDIIHIEKIGLVSLEHYASNFKVIEILGSDVYPATKWKKLGKISTNFTKSFELFNIYEYCKNYDEDNCWVKYLKFHVLSHHNLENNYYCTLTHLQIFASSGVDMLSDKIYSDENINKIEKDLQDNYMDQNNEQLYDQEIIENLEELYENNESVDDTLSSTTKEKKTKKKKTSTNDDNDKIHMNDIYYDNIKKNDEKRKKKKKEKSTRTQAKSLDTKLIDKDLMNTKQIEKELLDTKLIENEFIHNKLFDTDMIEKELMDTELIENELMNYELFDKDIFLKENYFNDEQQRLDESNADQQNDMYVIKNNKDIMKEDYYIKRKKKLVTDNTKELNKCSSYKSIKRDKFFENIKREDDIDDEHNENIYINIKNNKTPSKKKKKIHIFDKNIYYNILILLYYLFNQHIKNELYHFNMLKNKMHSSFVIKRFYINTRYKYINKKYINFINFIKVLKENYEQKSYEYQDNEIYQKLYIKQQEQKEYIYNLIMNTQNKYGALIKMLPFSSIQFLLKRKKWIPILYTMYKKKEFVKKPYFSMINREERKKGKRKYTIINDDYISLNTFKKNHIIIFDHLIYTLFFSNILCNGDLICLFENKILLSKAWISRSNIKHFIRRKYIFDNHYYNDEIMNILKNIYLSPHFYFFKNIFISHKFKNKIYLKFHYNSYYDKKSVLKYMHNNNDNINMNDILYIRDDVNKKEFMPYSLYKNYEYKKESINMIEREKKKKMYKRKPYENYMILYVIYRLKSNNIYHFEFIKYCTNLINNWSKKERKKKNKHVTLLYTLERKYLSTFYNKMKCVDIYKSYKILKKKRVFVGAHHHIFNNEYNNNDNNSSNTCRRDKLINNIYKYLQKRKKLNYIPILHNNMKQNEIEKVKKQKIKIRENIYNSIILFFHKFVYRKLPYIYFLNFWIYNKNDMLFQMNNCLDILFDYVFNNIKKIIIIIKKKKKKNIYIFLQNMVRRYIKQNCFLKKNFSSLFLKKINKNSNRYNNKKGYIKMNKNYIIFYLHYRMEKSKLCSFDKYFDNIEMSYYIKSANNKNYISLSDIYFFSKNKEYYLTNYITWFITNMILMVLKRKDIIWKVDINKKDIYENKNYSYDKQSVEGKKKINAYRKINIVQNYLYNNDSYNDEYFYYDEHDDEIGNNNFNNNNVLYGNHYKYDHDNKNAYLNYYLTNRIIINPKKNFLDNVCLTIGDMENIIYSNYYIDKFEKKDSKYHKCMKKKIKENIIYDEDKDSNDNSSIKILNEIKKNEESNNKLIHDVYDIISEYDNNVSDKYRGDDKNVQNNHNNTYKRNKETSKNISLITGKNERNENIKFNKKRKEQIKKTKKINFIEEYDNKIIDENLNFPNDENCIREEKIEEKSKNTRGHALLTLVDKIKTIETKNNYLLSKLRDIIKITNNKTKIIYHMLSNFKILQNTISLLLKYIMINEKHMKDLNMNKKNSDMFYKILKEICLEQINDKSKNMDSLKYLCKYLQNFLYDEFERKYLFEKIRSGNYPMCDDDQNILLHNKNGYHQKNTDFIIKEKKKSLFNFLYYENHCHNDIFKTPLIYYNSQVDRLQTVYLNIFDFIVNLKVVKFLIYKFKYWKNIFKRYIINGLSYNINPYTFLNYSTKDNYINNNNNMNNANNVINHMNNMNNNNNSNYHYANWYQIFTNNFYVIFFYILFIIFIVNNFLCFMFYKHLSNKLNAYVKTCTCHNK